MRGRGFQRGVCCAVVRHRGRGAACWGLPQAGTGAGELRTTKPPPVWRGLAKWLPTSSHSQTTRLALQKPIFVLTVKLVTAAEHPRRRRRRAPPAVGVLQTARAWARLQRTVGDGSQTDLAHHLGVSRARVSQVLSVLKSKPEVQAALAARAKAGCPVTEREWRRLRQMPPGRRLSTLAGGSTATPTHGSAPDSQVRASRETQKPVKHSSTK